MFDEDDVQPPNDERALTVMKFGGSSVGSAVRLEQVLQLVAQAAPANRLVVVVSAASGVTDVLEAGLDRPPDHLRVLCEFLEERYRRLSEEVMDAVHARRYGAELAVRLMQFRDNQERLGWGSEPAQADVLAVGERLSAPLVAGALQERGLDAEAVDAAALIRTSADYRFGIVDQASTKYRVQSWFQALPAGRIPVVTGFIGSTEAGLTTTLGRGGSDYTASLLAYALGANRLERWTDTNGVYTDDPRHNPAAERLPILSLEDAAPINQEGRLGMHRRALEPLLEACIPLHVRNTGAPEHPGTVIVPSLVYEGSL